MGVDVTCAIVGEVMDWSSELSSLLKPDGREGVWPTTFADPDGERFGDCVIGDTDTSLRCGIVRDVQESQWL